VEVPEAVVSEVPTVRTYRYFRYSSSGPVHPSSRSDPRLDLLDPVQWPGRARDRATYPALCIYFLLRGRPMLLASSERAHAHLGR
jgi:hypothetical protein